MSILSKFRDPVSGLSHGVGALIALVGFYYLMVAASTYGSDNHIVSFAIFGVSLFLMFASSTLYHLFNGSEETIKLFRKIDHIMIFMLIAGTYTPFCLIVLKDQYGFELLMAVWAIAFFGIFKKIFWLHAPRLLSTVVYLLMGWLALLVIYPLIQNLPYWGMFWLALGGVFYSVGAFVYGFKWPNIHEKHFGFHEIWHLFVLAGAFSHFWSIYAYVTYL